MVNIEPVYQEKAIDPVLFDRVCRVLEVRIKGVDAPEKNDADRCGRGGSATRVATSILIGCKPICHVSTSCMMACMP